MMVARPARRGLRLGVGKRPASEIVRLGTRGARVVYGHGGYVHISQNLTLTAPVPALSRTILPLHNGSRSPQGR